MISSRSVVALLSSGALVLVGCSDGSDDAGVVAAPAPTATETTVTTATTGTTATTMVQEQSVTDASADDTDAASASVELDELGVSSPGEYTSDLLSLSLELTTTESFRLTRAYPGMIEFESLGSSPEAYRGVAFMDVDTLIDSDRVGRHLARVPATDDLDAFLRSRDGIEVRDERSDTLGGLPARGWRIGSAESCDNCWFETLFNTTGFQNQWGNPPGYVQEIWTIDAPGSPLVVTVEAPQESFDSWNEAVWEHLFADMEFGSPTGFSLRQPTGEFAAGFGPYAIGRAELEVVDASRTTSQVQDQRGLVVPAADERRLLLSVAYPSDAGGFGAEPADGTFPLVVVAPAVRGASIVLPAERQLASHGFVVVAVRFPESSFPGGALIGIPSQPGDVSFVIDEIAGGVLPAPVGAVTDTERIGLVGHSGGATTGFGLLTSSCCQDTRIDALVAHAGTPYDFDSSAVPTVAPILHVVSNGDEVISTDVIRAFHEQTEGPSTLAVLADALHLQWLDPYAAEYEDSFDLQLAFLDEHLRDVATSVVDAAGPAFVEVVTR